MKKRLLALALVAVMVFSATACKKNDNKENETTSVAPSQETTTAAFDTTPVKQTTALADYSQYITLGQYTGLEIEVEDANITEEDMKTYRDEITKYYNSYVAEKTKITDRVTAVGDTINFDFKGLLDGVAFDGGTATGASITLGSGQFIESLESQLSGLEIGKEYSLDCVFPDPYLNNPDLAGKEVVFVVTVHYIEGDPIELEYGDELISKYSGGQYTDVATFEAEFKAEVEAEAKANQTSQYQAFLLEKIIENANIASLPEEKVESTYNDYVEYYEKLFEYYAGMSGTDVTTFLATQYDGLTWDEVKEECKSMAEQEVTYIILSTEIFRSLNMEITDEEYNKYVQETAANSGLASGAEFVEMYGEDYIRETIVFNRVSDYLTENNKMVVGK